MHGWPMMAGHGRFMAFYDPMSSKIKLSLEFPPFLAQASGISKHRQWLLLRSP